MFRRIGTSTMLVTVLCALAMAEANAELPKSCLQDLRSFEDQSTTITVSWQCTRSGARLAEALAKVGLADADIAAITRPVQVEFSWQEGSSFTHQLFWTPTSSAEPNRGEAGRTSPKRNRRCPLTERLSILEVAKEVFAQRGLSPALQIHTKEHVRQNKVLPRPRDCQSRVLGPRRLLLFPNLWSSMTRSPNPLSPAISASALE